MGSLCFRCAPTRRGTVCLFPPLRVTNAPKAAILAFLPKGEDMKLPSAIAAGSVAIALVAGGFALGHGLSDDNGSSSDKAQVAGQVFTREPTTTSTIAAPAASSQAPQAPSTTTVPPAAKKATTAPHPASATVLQATVSTTPPSTTPATVVVNPQCGSGTAAARVSGFTQPRTHSASTDYQSDIAVDVDNGINRPIQLESLSVRVTLENGQVDDVVFTGAPGTVIQSGNTGHYTVSVNTGKSPAKSFAMSSFAFHTAGHPECPGRSA